jgi:hypothetical protein
VGLNPSTCATIFFREVVEQWQQELAATNRGNEALNQTIYYEKCVLTIRLIIALVVKPQLYYVL